MRAVAQYDRKSIVGDIPSVQPSMSAPRFFNELASHIQGFEQKFSEQARQKYLLQMDTTRKKEINRIAQENKGDPDAMQSAFEANKNGLSSTITNDDLRNRFDQSYDIEVLPFLNRAQAEKEQRLDEENTVATLDNIASTKDSMMKSVSDLWSKDPVVSQTAGNVLMKGLVDIQSALQTRKGDGSYLLNPAVVAQGVRPYVDELGKNLVLAHIQNTTDKQQAIQDFIAGNIGIDIDDGDGKVYRFNAKEAMTAEAYAKTKEVIDTKIAEIISREALSLNNEDSEKAIDFIKKSIPKGYENRDALIDATTTEYLARLGISQKVNKENKLLSNSALADDLAQAILNGTSDSVEMDERILSIEDAGTRQAFKNYRAQGGNTDTEPAVLMMLTKLARENPNTFLDTDLTHYIDRLSAKDMSALKSAQQDIATQKKGGESNGAYTSILTTSDHVKRYMTLVGIDEKDDPAEAYKAKQLLEMAINDFEQSKYDGKKKATTDDIDTIILRLAGDFKERDWIFDNDVKLRQFAGEPVEKRAKVYQPFENIDGDDLASINIFLGEKGISGNPTQNSSLKKLYESLFPAILAGDRETIDFLILDYKGRK